MTSQQRLCNHAFCKDTKLITLLKISHLNQNEIRMVTQQGVATSTRPENSLKIGIDGDTSKWMEMQMNHDNSLQRLAVPKLNIL